jgi:dienelactone hydrolase
VIGFSHGGWTAAWVTRRRYDRQFPGLLKASIDYYGPCRSPETQHTVPLLALAREDDTSGFPAPSCRGIAGKLRPGQVFEVYTHPGAAHGFDNAKVPYRTSNFGHPMGYDRAGAEDSFVRVDHRSAADPPWMKQSDRRERRPSPLPLCPLVGGGGLSFLLAACRTQQICGRISRVRTENGRHISY